MHRAHAHHTAFIAQAEVVNYFHCIIMAVPVKNILFRQPAGDLLRSEFFVGKRYRRHPVIQLLYIRNPMNLDAGNFLQPANQTGAEDFLIRFDGGHRGVEIFSAPFQTGKPGEKSPYADPDIALAWPVGVGVTDKYAYIGDSLNRRLIQVTFTYEAEETCGIK